MPLGIGELTSLQSLTKIIVGGENGIAIAALQNLKYLHGKITFLGLGNVENAMHARKAMLSQKRLSELELNWASEFTVSKEETRDHREVLNELKPYNGTLEKLKIVSYGGTEFPNWIMDPSFLGLTHVSIYGCEECTNLPRLGELPSLKELFIGNMSKVRVVGWEFLGSGLAFPSLEILSFDCMCGWEVWSTNRGAVDAVFPCLQELHIKGCPNLVEVSLETLPSLRVLQLRKCGHTVLTSLVGVASLVTKLKIDDILGLTDELWRGVIGYLGAVEEVSIQRCNKIKYLWESEAEASNILVNLVKLDVDGCSNLVSLGEKEEDNCGDNLTTLRSLDVRCCNSLEQCSFPNSLESLRIHCCDSITSVSFLTGGGQKLKSLAIGDCKQLLEEELGGGEKTRMLINSSMHMLEALSISYFPNRNWNLELSCFIHLTRLIITDCPNMDASFPRGNWPPKLSFLMVGGLKKRISEWGPQNFPSSLVKLRLYGRLSEDVSNFCQLSHLLPSSLIRLEIIDFEKLESVSMGLQ